MKVYEGCYLCFRNNKRKKIFILNGLTVFENILCDDRSTFSILIYLENIHFKRQLIFLVSKIVDHMFYSSWSGIKKIVDSFDILIGQILSCLTWCVWTSIIVVENDPSNGTVSTSLYFLKKATIWFGVLLAWTNFIQFGSF